METDALLAFLTAQPHERWVGQRAEAAVTSRVNSMGQSDFNVTRFADCEAVLRDSETFSSSINAEVIGQFMGDLILAMDGRQHGQYRKLVSHAFRPSVLAQWEATLVLPTITRILDAVVAKGTGKGELVGDVTYPYPVQIICAMVGVPLDDVDQFALWALQINTGPLAPEQGMIASKAMRDYLTPIVEARKAEPRDDLISELVQAEVDGEKLTDEKIYGFLRLLLPAGAETTYRMMGNVLTALLNHPEAMQRCRTDAAYLDKAIEETLRWEASVTTVSRVTTRDVELGGCPIPKGSPVTVVNGSANRDERKYADPDVWDPERPDEGHLAFGWGAHLCLGMHLARRELRVGVAEVLRRLPNLRLDPDMPAPTIMGEAFRGPDALHVLFDA
ncbi:MAG TPA: cytochrome P450 [Mycobacteriales bacterium]|nr:cytochrome P450 [Mycobacteriales bacterium]